MIDCYKNCEDRRNGICPPMKVFCPKKLAEHDSELLNRCSMTFKSIIHNRHGQMPSETEKELFADIDTFIVGMKAEVSKNANEP